MKSASAAEIRNAKDRLAKAELTLFGARTPKAIKAARSAVETAKYALKTKLGKL